MPVDSYFYPPLVRFRRAEGDSPTEVTSTKLVLALGAERSALMWRPALGGNAHASKADPSLPVSVTPLSKVLTVVPRDSSTVDARTVILHWN